MKVKSNSIASRRKQQGKSQRELAEFLNVSRVKLSLIENNVKSPSLEIALQIAEFLGVDLADVFEF